MHTLALLPGQIRRRPVTYRLPQIVAERAVLAASNLFGLPTRDRSGQPSDCPAGSAGRASRAGAGPVPIARAVRGKAPLRSQVIIVSHAPVVTG